MSNYSINILPKQSEGGVAYCESENLNLLTFPPFSLPNPTGKSSLNELFHCWTNEALKESKSNQIPNQFNRFCKQEYYHMSDFSLMIYFRIEWFDTILAAVTVGYSQHGTMNVGQKKKKTGLRDRMW